MLSIDEAITHARDVSSRKFDDRVHCIRCSEFHKQIAEWLEELKVYQQHKIICNKGYNAGYNKALNNFVNACEKKSTTIFRQRYVDMRDIVRIAEQLKAGGENDNLRR